MAEPSNEYRQPLDHATASELARHISPLLNDMEDDYDSDDNTSFEADPFTSDAQKHWDESVKQLDQALFFVLCPVIGRILGRRFAKNLWVRFVDWRWQLCQARNLFTSDKSAS